VKSDAHRSKYSALHDRESPDSAALCGSCHDIVTQGGVHLERTFLEWRESLFAQPGFGQLTCGGCHMTGDDAPAADFPGVPERRVHEHTFAGVDVALTPFPELEAQREAIARDLDPAIGVQLCAADAGGGEVDLSVRLDNIMAGHMWPSGAAQDRRAWVELTAFSGDTRVYASGLVGDGETPADPNLWLFGDRMLDTNGVETHMFWEAASYVSELLPPTVTNDPTDPRFDHSRRRTYRIPAGVDRVEVKLRLRAMNLATIDDLIASGDLDPAVRARIPTFDLLGSRVTWRASDGFVCRP
jgi:hypothetical protein